MNHETSGLAWWLENRVVSKSLRVNVEMCILCILQKLKLGQEQLISMLQIRFNWDKWHKMFVRKSRFINKNLLEEWRVENCHSHLYLHTICLRHNLCVNECMIVWFIRTLKYNLISQSACPDLSWAQSRSPAITARLSSDTGHGRPSSCRQGLGIMARLGKFHCTLLLSELIVCCTVMVFGDKFIDIPLVSVWRHLSPWVILKCFEIPITTVTPCCGCRWVLRDNVGGVVICCSHDG